MHRITHYKTPCPEAVNSQILQMVVDYLTDISAVGLGPSNLLYNVYQYAVGYEMHLYLEALNGEKGTEVELLVATDEEDPEQVIGFLLYLPVQGDWEACSVAYMAVREGHRRQGVARAMIAELACTVGKVPYFEALGFEVIGQRETQVLMSTRHYRSNGLRGYIDTTPIYRSLEVQQIHTYLLNRNSKRAMLDAEKQRDRHLDQTTRHTEEFVRQRLTVH